MACDICKHQEETRTATRVLNRALRTVNRNLRRREEALIAQRDATVEALLETPSEAEDALKRIWSETSLGFAEIRPDDYEFIADVAIAAIKAQRR